MTFMLSCLNIQLLGNVQGRSLSRDTLSLACCQKSNFSVRRRLRSSVIVSFHFPCLRSNSIVWWHVHLKRINFLRYKGILPTNSTSKTRIKHFHSERLSNLYYPEAMYCSPFSTLIARFSTSTASVFTYWARSSREFWSAWGAYRFARYLKKR